MRWEGDLIISDSGHTAIMKDSKGQINTFQHGIAEWCLTEEDKLMTSQPKKVWEQMQEEKK